MKRFILGVICIIFLILDNTLMSFISIRGTFPSLLFTFAILFSILNGYWESIYIGSLSGILQDIYFSNGFGFNSFTNLLLCLLAAYIGENIFKQKRLIPVISTFVLTLIKFIVIYALIILFKIKMNLDGILIMSFYNMFIAFVIYGWIYHICNKDYMKRQWKFNEK